MKKLISSAAVIVSMLIAMLVPPGAARQVSIAANGAVWPVDSQYHNITTYFDPNRNTSGYGHNAIDIEADSGANIYAVLPGSCVAAEFMGAYGYMVMLWHESQGIYTFYSHCSSMAVTVGETVEAGQVIAYVGMTGQADGNHLHYGICDTLLGGYPAPTYYDPLTYFTYGEAAAPADCGCTADYAGTYTTKGVQTFLNIRSGHSATSAILGTIYPGEEFNVVKADGNWAHVEFKGVIGCVSMEYIQKTGNVVSEITATGTSFPEGYLKQGAVFSVKGKLTSNLNIKKVWGGVYSSDGKTPVQTAEAYPNSTTYDLIGLDSRILFDALTVGSYVYRIEAQDSSGQTYTIVSSVFNVGDPPATTAPVTTTTTKPTTTTTTTVPTTTTTAKPTTTTTAKPTTTTAKPTTTSAKPAVTTSTKPVTTASTTKSAATTTIRLLTSPPKSTVTKATTAVTAKPTTTISSTTKAPAATTASTTKPVTDPSVGTGDINGDGKMTIADAVIFQSFMLGRGKFTDAQMKAADVDKNGRIDTFDFLRMKIMVISALNKS